MPPLGELRLLDDGDPDALASVSRRRDGIDEAMQPDARVYHHASEFVFARQDAALRIIGVVTGMDADALKARNALQQGQPLLESRRLGDEHGISALGYGSLALHLLRLLLRHSPQTHILLLGQQGDAQQVAPRWLQGIAEVVLPVQLVHIYHMAEAALLVLIERIVHLALHLLVLQDIHTPYGVSILLSYSFEYDFHNCFYLDSFLRKHSLR